MNSQRFPMTLPALAGAVALIAITANDANSQWAARGGHAVTPESSIEQPEHVGFRAHTNFKFYVPADGMAARQGSPEAIPQASGPPFKGYFYETPASLACVYKLVPSSDPGCNPNTVTANTTTGSRAIAIVDAYHYPTAISDLAVFSAQFGLPAPTSSNFQVVYASGRQPRVNADWNVEAALDIQWAHAMAPHARIYLVEAASSSFADLLNAVSVANSLLTSASGGQVSMSWGGSEFSAESFYDGYFTQSGVVYFASSGDNPGVIWPAASRSVVSVGGTSLSRNPNTGAFQRELAWQSGGGGASLYESLPSFQIGVPGVPQIRRATPDVAADADPSTGVWVYVSPNWYIVGGTSVSAPVWAGIVNSAGRFAKTSQDELAAIYANLGTVSYPSNFRDIAAGSGSCGPNQGYLTAPGWDFCTGLGSPLGESGK
jgi:subtilase family serine protease